MLTHIAPEFTPTTWSAVTARPTWVPTFRTPGMDRSSAVAWLVILFISGSDVPGAAFQETSSSVSFSDGDMAGVRKGSATSPATTIAPTPTYAQRGRWRTAPRKPAVACAEPAQHGRLGAVRAAPSRRAAGRAPA